MEKRTLKILEAIVDEYIRTGEAVGSKLIAERLGNTVSSATIRNEMAALEQQGLLEHTHTSSGRQPTYQGLRFYIENIMPPQELPEEDREEIDKIFEGLDAENESEFIENAGHALAEVTKCAIVSASAVSKFSVISKVEVIPTGRRMYVLLLITSEGSIKNRVCRLSFDLTEEQVDFFKRFINRNLTGVNLEMLSEEYIEQMAQAMGSYVLTLSPLLKAVADLSAEMMQQQVELSGERNLLECKEFTGSEIVALIEGKNELTKLLDDSFSGISVKFGKDSDTFAVSNSSVISASFSKGDRKAGSFSVIGPVRLDYKKIIPYIEYFSAKVTNALSPSDEVEQLESIEKEAEGIEQEE